MDFTLPPWSKHFLTQKVGPKWSMGIINQFCQRKSAIVFPLFLVKWWNKSPSSTMFHLSIMSNSCPHITCRHKDWLTEEHLEEIRVRDLSIARFGKLLKHGDNRENLQETHRKPQSLGFDFLCPLNQPNWRMLGKLSEIRLRKSCI